MFHDADVNGADDRRRREEIDARNELDLLANGSTACCQSSKIAYRSTRRLAPMRSSRTPTRRSRRMPSSRPGCAPERCVGELAAHALARSSGIRDPDLVCDAVDAVEASHVVVCRVTLELVADVALERDPAVL